MKNGMTILDIMEHGGLRIPSVQRDYVMGRPGMEVTKKLQTSLRFYFKALFEGEKDDLYFIYGIRRDEESPLMLFDGQQRLTTLAILAWFCDTQLAVVKEWKIEYAMRRAASSFMHHLFKTRCVTHNNPWLDITKSQWFLPEMEEDATVASIHRVLDNIGKMYAEHVNAGRPPVPEDPEQLKDRLRNIIFSLEDMKELHIGEDSFGQVFLKMNARGLPLTPWEIMKETLDRHATDCPDWKSKIDGEWAQGLWDKIAAKNIETLDSAMHKIVRMAIRRQTWDFPIPDWLREIGEVPQTVIGHSSEEPARGEIRFWRTCARYFTCAACGDLALEWNYNRSDNPLWPEPPKDQPKDQERPKAESNGKTDAFRKFLQRDNRSFGNLELLRFDLLCSEPFENARLRTKRICLNILDALPSLQDADAAKLQKVLAQYLKDSDLDAVSNQVRREQNGKSWLSNNVVDALCHQIEQEIIKSSLEFDEREVVQIERDPLVFRSQIDFLLWNREHLDGSRVLLDHLEAIRGQIKRDWITFYANLLNNLEDGNDQRNYPCISEMPVPRANEACWGEKLLNLPAMARACIQLHSRPRSPDGKPSWLLHLVELLQVDGDPGSFIQIVKHTGGWMYALLTEHRWMPTAIRLDWSVAECSHRRLLQANYIRKSDCVGTDENKPGMLGRDRDDYPGETVYYDVNAESWWKEDGIPTPVKTVPKQNTESGVAKSAL